MICLGNAPSLGIQNENIDIFCLFASAWSVDGEATSHRQQLRGDLEEREGEGTLDTCYEHAISTLFTHNDHVIYTSYTRNARESPDLGIVFH